MKKSYKGVTGKWTKYGGRVYDVASRQDEVPHDWVCQSCGDHYPSIMPAYKFEYPQGEYMRVCPICYVDGCIKFISRLSTEEFIDNPWPELI